MAAALTNLVLVCSLLVCVSSVDYMRVARCRSQCISSLSGPPPVHDSECRTRTECLICWENCYNLLHDWKLWGKLCTPVPFCTKSPGCMASCKAVQNQKPTSMNRRQLKFKRVQLRYQNRTRMLSFSWRGPPTDSAVALVYWLFYKDTKVRGRWSSLTQTLNSSLEFSTTVDPHRNAFRVVAVDQFGEVTQSGMIRLTNGSRIPEERTTGSPNAGSEPPSRHVDKEWDDLVRGMRTLTKSLTSGNNSIVDSLRERLVSEAKKSLMKSSVHKNTPLILGVALSFACLVVVGLLVFLLWFTRSQQLHVRELRSALGDWSSKVGSSVRSSVHRAQHSFRRSVFNGKSSGGSGSSGSGRPPFRRPSTTTTVVSVDSGVMEAPSYPETAPCLPPRHPSICKSVPQQQQQPPLSTRQNIPESYEYVSVDTEETDAGQ